MIATLKNQRGVAMLMALTSITILAVLAAELVYETEVYHKIVYNSVDQIRAQELAKSGLKLARLQVLGTQRAMEAIQQLGAGAAIGQTDIDRIWQTPLILPPPLPPNASIGTRDAVKKLTDELELPGNITVHIQGESGKLNLNRLVWKIAPKPAANNTNNPNTGSPTNPPPAPSPAPTNSNDPNATDPLAQMKRTLTKTLDELLRQKRDEDDEFAIKYESLNGEELIGNILAWIDPKVEVDGENAPKQGYYRQLDPPYEIKNAPLFSMNELHMVKGFDDTLVEFMEKHFTTLITEGININAINTVMIKAIFPAITDDNLKKLEERRTEIGGFNKVDDFWKFMQELGFTQDNKKELDDAGIQIVTSETAFRVSIEAKSGDSRKVWVAHLGAEPPKASPNPNQPSAPPPPNANTPNNSNTPPASGGVSVGAPAVVYLKTD